MDLANYETDPNAVEGRWFEFDGARFKIAYYSRPDFTRIASRIHNRYSKQALKQDPALNMVMTIEVTAEAVLLDWEGVKANGVEIPATKANKILALGHQPFRDWVFEISQAHQNFAKEAQAEDAEVLKSSD